MNNRRESKPLTTKDNQVLVSKALYPPPTVLKAAYAFIDKCYIHVGETVDSWIISLTAKDSSTNADVFIKEFENELLSQAVHLIIYNQTHTIRELLLARAMSSSMVIEDNQIPPVVHEETEIPSEELKSILVSWFDNNE